MCDYSLHHVANRPAKIEDKLVATKFPMRLLAASRRSGSRTLRSACCLVPRSHSTRMSNASRRSASASCRTRRSGSGSRASGKSIWTTPWPITMRWNFPTDRWF